MTQNELNPLLKAHAKWWATQGEAGENLTLNDENLSNLDFRGSNLKGANLSRCNAQNANFEDVNMTSINVTNTDFRGANFTNANMTKIDFRNVRIDYSTCFDNTIANGMLVDWATFNLLPEHIQEQNPVIVNRNVVEMIIEIRSETKDIVLQALSDMGDYLEQHNTGIQIATIKEGSQYRFKVEADSEEKVKKIREDILFFGDVLAGRERLDNEKEQAFLESRYRRLAKNYEEMEMDKREIKMLYAKSRVEFEELKKELHEERTGKVQFLNILENMSETIRNTQISALPPAKNKSTNYLFATADKREVKIELSEIICCLTISNEVKAANLYLKNAAEPLKIRFGRFEDLAKELADLNPKLFKCSKGAIINIDDVETSHSIESNRLEITLKGFEGEIVVGRDYKEPFEKLYHA